MTINESYAFTGVVQGYPALASATEALMDTADGPSILLGATMRRSGGVRLTRKSTTAVGVDFMRAFDFSIRHIPGRMRGKMGRSRYFAQGLVDAITAGGHEPSLAALEAHPRLLRWTGVGSAIDVWGDRNADVGPVDVRATFRVVLPVGTAMDVAVGGKTHTVWPEGAVAVRGDVPFTVELHGLGGYAVGTSYRADVWRVVIDDSSGSDGDGDGDGDGGNDDEPGEAAADVPATAGEKDRSNAGEDGALASAKRIEGDAEDADENSNGGDVDMFDVAADTGAARSGKGRRVEGDAEDADRDSDADGDANVNGDDVDMDDGAGDGPDVKVDADADACAGAGPAADDEPDVRMDDDADGRHDVGGDDAGDCANGVDVRVDSDGGGEASKGGVRVGDDGGGGAPKGSAHGASEDADEPDDYDSATSSEGSDARSAEYEGDAEVSSPARSPVHEPEPDYGHEPDEEASAADEEPDSPTPEPEPAAAAAAAAAFAAAVARVAAAGVAPVGGAVPGGAVAGAAGAAPVGAVAAGSGVAGSVAAGAARAEAAATEAAGADAAAAGAAAEAAASGAAPAGSTAAAPVGPEAEADAGPEAESEGGARDDASDSSFRDGDSEEDQLLSQRELPRRRRRFTGDYSDPNTYRHP